MARLRSIHIGAEGTKWFGDGQRCRFLLRRQCLSGSVVKKARRKLIFQGTRGGAPIGGSRQEMPVSADFVFSTRYRQMIFH